MSSAHTGAPDLDARYGRTRRVRERWMIVAVAVGFIAAVAAWVVWGSGVFHPSANLEARDVGFTQIDDGAIEVRWELTVEPGNRTACALQALSPKFAIVGWRVVEIESSDRRTRSFSEVVRTSQPATTGLIYECWLL